MSWWIDEHGTPQRGLVQGTRVVVEGAAIRRADRWFTEPLRGSISTRRRVTWRCTPRGDRRSLGGVATWTERFVPTSNADPLRANGGSIEVWSFALTTPSTPSPRAFHYRAGAPGTARLTERGWTVLTADATRATMLAWVREPASSSLTARLMVLSASAPPRTLDPLPDGPTASSVWAVSAAIAREGAVTATLVRRHRDMYGVPDVAVGAVRAGRRDGRRPAAQ